jgi:probable HAF family extracellular repeat protein
MNRSTSPGAARPSALAWNGLTLSVLLVLAACGGGSSGPAPTVSSGAAGGDAVAVGGGVPTPASTSPTPSTTEPGPVAPPVQQATWAVRFVDPQGQGGAQSLNRLGQLAFTGVTALGPRARFFDGATVHELAGGASTALAVNEAGQVAGRFEGDFTRAFRWDAGTQQVPVVLDTSPDVSSSAASVNASGVVGGTQSSRRNIPGSAIRWTPGGLPQGLTPVGLPPLGAEGRFINAGGAVAGVSNVSVGTAHAAYWPAGGSAVRDLGTLGGAASTPVALNDAGQVAGNAEPVDGPQHAFTWSEAAGLRDLGTLGGPASTANGLNASGWVVGTADTADGATVAFLWRDGAMDPLGTLGGRTSAASAINAAGLVGGNAETAGGVQHAFVWSAAMGLVDLNDRVAGSVPGVLQSVLAVADDGTVLAMAEGGLVLLRPVGTP